MPLFRHAAAQLLRLLPSSSAHGLASHWRDLHRLAKSDVAVVSFPKSGRTFVRVMLARLYLRQFGVDDREALKFSTLARAPAAVPRTLFTHDGDAMRRPSQIKINRSAYKGHKVVLLARHPGDVVVSRYYHLKHRSRDPARQLLAQQPLESFIWTDRGGIPSIVTFLNAWADLSRQGEDIIILRYEDFLQHPESALSELAKFIGLASTDADIRDAVEFARFDNLKQKEREGYFTSGRLGARNSGNEQSYKVRSGKSGGFRAQLSGDQQGRIISYIQERLDPVFGYER